MLNVSDAVKQAYINGNAQTEIFLTVTTTDGVVHEYNPRNILSGSVSIVESLCSSETFDISRVEKNELTFTLFNISEGISGLQGGNVVAKQRVYTDASDETVYTDIPLGTYTIAEAMNDGDYLYKCTAYEATTVKLDNLIDEWWKNLTFPITLRNLAISMFQYLGCAYDIPATFTNSDYSIETLNADFEGTTGAEILGYIQEIVGGFFKADRQGVIKLKVPTPVSSGLYPHIGLYPREGLYPRKSNRAFGDDTTAGAGDWDYPQIVGDLQLGDYDVKSVTKVQIRGTEDDIGIIAGSGTNTYVIQGNPLLFNLTAEDGATIAQNILDQVGQIAYKPFSGKFMSQPYVEVGDIAKIETYAGKEGDSPIFQRTLSGARLAFDNFQSLGLEYREQVSSVNRKLTTINQRTHEIKNTVDEFSSTVSQIESTVNTHTTQIAQNADNISLQAMYTGNYNLLVNSDFTELGDPTAYWELQNCTAEYVDDSLFGSGSVGKNAHGKALKITTEANKFCYLKQTININKIVDKDFWFMLSVRRDSADTPQFTTSIRIKDADGNSLGWFRGSYNVGAGYVISVRQYFLKSYFENIEISTIEVFIQSLSTYTDPSIYYVNNCYATFSDTAPTWWTWTDIPKNNLISQINIAPDGIKIQGEKIDIWGVTTIHNSDGSGETVLTGSTIKSAIIETGVLKGVDSSLTFDMSTSSAEYKIKTQPNTIVIDGTTYRGLTFTDENWNGAIGLMANLITLKAKAVQFAATPTDSAMHYTFSINDTTGVSLFEWKYSGTGYVPYTLLSIGDSFTSLYSPNESSYIRLSSDGFSVRTKRVSNNSLEGYDAKWISITDGSGNAHLVLAAY